QSKTVRATRSSQHFETVVAREIAKQPRKVRVVFDDQKDNIIRLKQLAVILYLGCCRMPNCVFFGRWFRSLGCRTCCLPGRQTRMGERQVQRERASLSRRAQQLYFATQKPCQFATDRQSQPGAAVLATGAGIGLLKRLKDQPLLFDRYSDS